MDPEKEQLIRDACEELSDLLVSKQKDYGDAALRRFGELGILVRVSDKTERLINLTQSGNEPRNESVEDTWIDIAGYAILGLLMRRANPSESPAPKTVPSMKQGCEWNT